MYDNPMGIVVFVGPNNAKCLMFPVKSGLHSNTSELNPHI